MKQELTLEEYKVRESEFFKKCFEYIDKKVAINKEEHQFIEGIEGADFNEKSDKYFDDETYASVVDKYQNKRKRLNKKYKGYRNQFEADFYTEITEEAIKFLKLSNISEKFLEKVKCFKGRKCYPHSDHKEIYTLIRAVVSPGDYYYDLVNENGNHMFYSCVGAPEWIEEDNE